MSNLLFVLGAEKTGTSTIVGILNCHPEIFIMHEWFVDKKATRHGKSSYLFDPNIKKSMRRYSKNTVYVLFKSMSAQFLKAKYKYKYFGDKWAELGDADKINLRIKDFCNSPHVKTIFTIRDIRTWICHNRINRIHKNSENVVPTAINYLYYFILSFKLKNNIHIRMEDIIVDPPTIVEKINKFLQPHVKNLVSHSNDWWNKVGKVAHGYNTFPKTTHKWWIHHASARAKPLQAHIEVKLKQNAFWDDILPIFDKYYNLKVKISDSEIDRDAQTVLSFKNKYNLSINDCYEHIMYNDYKQVK